MSKFILFMHRAREGHEETDTTPMKIIECYACDWFACYIEHLWTWNDMPQEQDQAWTEVRIHARQAHRALARIVRVWKP